MTLIIIGILLDLLARYTYRTAASTLRRIRFHTHRPRLLSAPCCAHGQSGAAMRGCPDRRKDFAS